MARRLLGADSATVFNVQEPEEEAASQVPHSSWLPREADYPVPSPCPPYGQSWGQLCGEQRAGQRKDTVIKSASQPAFIEHILC